jgi:hypothetical protein
MTASDVLARAFVRRLLHTLTPAEVAEVRQRNVGYPSHSCASHDFCDSNDVMFAAFVETHGREPLLDQDGSTRCDDEETWNRAWAVAKRDYLTAEAERLMTTGEDNVGAGGRT